MAGERKPLSKKMRFDVFKRDGFVCQYCGAHPPSIVLHVDHINPVAEGGDNNIDNLITACEPCNLGKGANKLSEIPKSLQEKALEFQEREEQIKGYNAILESKANRIEDEAWDVAAILSRVDYVESYNREDLLSIKRFLELLPFSEVKDSARIAAASRIYSGKRYFKYFCGVCWNKVREGRDHA